MKYNWKFVHFLEKQTCQADGPGANCGPPCILGGRQELKNVSLEDYLGFHKMISE